MYSDIRADLVRKASAGGPNEFFFFLIPPLVRARSERRSSVFCCMAQCVRIAGGVAGSRTGNGELSLTLQESSVGVDELVRLDITNRDTGHVGGIWRESESSGGCW